MTRRRAGAILDGLMELVFGAGRLDRVVSNVERLLDDWHEKERDWGQLYLEHEPVTPRDRLLVEDLGVTMLLNSRVAGQAAASVHANARGLDLGFLPDTTLEETTLEDRLAVAGVVAKVAGWPWFGASLATKALHKKRPALIPVLDNQAIFGAYMNPAWPDAPASLESVTSADRIHEALEWITADLTRPENLAVWTELERREPGRSRIELFDMVWWAYFRSVEPVRR